MTTNTAPTIEIIAELAQGFEGRPEQARLLVRAAAAAGADAAKFQLVYAEELATPDYKHYGLFRSLEMADEVWMELGTCCRQLGIALHLDVFGARSLALAERAGAAALKVHGTDIANVGMLKQIAQAAVPKVLLGAGGATLPEIEQAVRLLADKEIVILLGFQGYPTPNDANQIARVRAVAKLFADRARVTIGFADHAPPEDALACALAATAVGAGARVIEKHLTLGRIMKLEDHESALNPDQFGEFVKTLRSCAEALGVTASAPDFGMSAAEVQYRQAIRRHVVVRHGLKAGASITPDGVVLKRTSAKNALTDLNSVYGKLVLRDLTADQPISGEDIQGG